MYVHTYIYIYVYMLPPAGEVGRGQVGLGNFTGNIDNYIDK